MKKLLTTVLLISSFTWACDQPYEEIMGIKVGCSLAEQGFSDSKTLEISNLDFFDYGQITQNNDQAISISVNKEYKVNKNDLNLVMPLVQSDIKMISRELSARWGLLDHSPEMYRVLSAKDFSKATNIELFAEDKISYTGSSIVDNVTVYIYREAPSKNDSSPNISLYVFYKLFDQSMQKKLKGP